MAYHKKLHSYELGRGYLFFVNGGKSLQLREMNADRTAWLPAKKLPRMVIGPRVKLVAVTLPARRKRT